MVKLERLANLAKNYYEEFIKALNDYQLGRERIYAVERLAQLLAQTILDYAAILASQHRGTKPSSYKQLAKFLAEKLELDKNLEEFLVGLAGFRNLLIHTYAEINQELENKAFKEIKNKTPAILEHLEQHAQRDPCLDQVKQTIEKIAEKNKLRYVVVFGSLAQRGCGEDIDLFIKLGTKPKNLLEIGQLLADFEDQLGTKVDLIVYEVGVDPVLAKTIVDEGIILYGDKNEAQEDLLKLYKQYLDYTILARKLHKQALGEKHVEERR